MAAAACCTCVCRQSLGMCASLGVQALPPAMSAAAAAYHVGKHLFQWRVVPDDASGLAFSHGAGPVWYFRLGTALAGTVLWVCAKQLTNSGATVSPLPVMRMQP
jgi:hypothetical protein